jgi:ABC-type amino acid transport substrate-binding protein
MTDRPTLRRTLLVLGALLLLPAGCAPDAGDAPEPRESFHAGPATPVERPTLAEARSTGQAELAFFFVPSSGFAYRDEAGRLTGVTAELLRGFAAWVARTEGFDVEVTWIEEPLWADFYGYVRDSRGGAFGIGNVTITEARGEELDFSSPYLQNIAVLVTHEDVSELSSMDAIGEAFSGLTALRYPGTLHETRLLGIRDAHFPDLSFREIASNDELVDGLSAGPATFGYIDIYNYWRAREAGRPLRRHPVGDDAAETFGIILPNDSDWTPLMAAYMEEIGGAEGPVLARLLREHLGEELAALLGGDGGGGREGSD